MSDGRGLDVTLFPDLDAYVKALQGTTVIRKILIANNGIAAVKAIRFLRKWSYEVFGNEREVCPGASCQTSQCCACSVAQTVASGTASASLNHFTPLSAIPHVLVYSIH